MKLIESLRGIENSFTNVKKVSKKEITKTELSESLFKAANQIDKRNYRTSYDLTSGYQKALEEAIEKINPDKRWFEVTDCDIRTTLLENHNNIEATIRRILNESEDDIVDIDDEGAIQRILDHNKKKEDYVFVDASGSTTKDKMIRATKEGLKKLPNAKVLYVSDLSIDEKLPEHGKGHCNPEMIGHYLSGEPINKAIFFTDEDYDSSRYDLEKIGVEVNTDLMSYNESLIEEPIGNESLKEKVVKKGSKWVNKGPEGTHGEFTTKKAADAQRKAIAANYDDDDTSYIINVSKSDSPKYVKKFEDDEIVTSTKKDDAKKFGTKSSAEKFIKDKDITGKVVTENIDDLGVDLGEFQEWIDYDMKHYGEISELTRKEIESAGLEIIKDDHGDYELIAKPYDGEYDESLKESDENLPDRVMYKIYEIEDTTDEYDCDWEDAIAIKLENDYGCEPMGFDYYEESGSAVITDIRWVDDNDYENESLTEDTVKQGSSWVNKGDTGETHGKFKTKKEADAQRRAMFAQGYKAEDCSSKECDEIDSSKETLTEEDADEEAYKKLKDGQSFKDALK